MTNLGVFPLTSSVMMAVPFPLSECHSVLAVPLCRESVGSGDLRRLAQLWFELFPLIPCVFLDLRLGFVIWIQVDEMNFRLLNIYAILFWSFRLVFAPVPVFDCSSTRPFSGPSIVCFLTMRPYHLFHVVGVVLALGLALFIFVFAHTWFCFQFLLINLEPPG